jgi:uncharacterized glyoxalase superfamily protein PhnB
MGTNPTGRIHSLGIWKLKTSVLVRTTMWPGPSTLPSVGKKSAPSVDSPGTSLIWASARALAVAAGEGNTILHAELTLGGGMVMLGTRVGEPPFRSARDARGISLIVADADAVYARAKEAAAEIVVDIEDKPYGGRGFACRDIWTATSGTWWTHASSRCSRVCFRPAAPVQ